MSDHDAVEQVITMAWRAQSTRPMPPPPEAIYREKVSCGLGGDDAEIDVLCHRVPGQHIGDLDLQSVVAERETPKWDD
jgi:hypothetical protein